MSSSNRCFLTWYRFLRRQVKWSSIPISWRIFHSLLWSTQSGPHFAVVNKAVVMFFWNSLAFSMLWQMLAIWSLVPLPFLNPAWILCTVEAWLGDFWTLLCYHVRWVQLCSSLNILWHCISLGLEWKLTFSSPVDAAEFSEFAGILSAALLQQHHLLGFEIAQLEFHHLH